MVTNQQVRRLMKLIQTEPSLAIAASKAGMDEKTARKYRRLAKLPDQCKATRQWRTRPDIFKDVWPEIEQILRLDASVEAVTIFDHLCRKYEGQFQPSHLRTLQRRIKVWRAQCGEPRELFFPQLHTPGQQCQSDYTHMGELNLTIAGQPFDHLFYHFTLTYSNWETGSICFSESFESLSAGLQNALWELGAVPQEHRTDSLSAAVNNLNDKEEFTASYQGLIDHYGLRATHNNPGQGHENGDVEQSHYRFKKAVMQELILRGSRDFATRQGYADFLRRLLKRRNATRKQHLAEEMAVMRPLPERRLEDYTREIVKVTRNSTVTIRHNLYSVRSQLIGERVEVRIYAEHLEVWYAGELMQRMERLRGEGKHAINYRHVIHSLVKKPGAFANYRWRSDLFPRLIFRIAYDCLQEHYPSTADQQYIRILRMAAEESQERVEDALRYLVDHAETITAHKVEELLAAQQPLPLVQRIEVDQVVLAAYDALLIPAEEVAH